jgi:nucleotide-binding universal stress UspA family protein
MAATRDSMSTASPAEPVPAGRSPAGAQPSPGDTGRSGPRIQLNRILCPVDFSDASRRALEYGVAIARWYKAELAALYVGPAIVQPVNLAEYPATMPLEPPRETLMRDLEQMLGAAEAQDIRTAVAVEYGGAVQQILRLAGSLPADLIVLGTHGRGGFDRLVLGSVTEKVLRKATCPVLTIPPKLTGLPAGGPAAFKHIVCAVDFSDSSLQGLEYACSLAQEAGGRLVLLHVLEGFASEPSQLQAQFDVPEYARSLERDARARLAEALPEEARTWCDIEMHVVVGRAHHEILKLADQKGADLIVMGVQGRNPVDLLLFGSTANQVVRQAACPVLTIRR